MSSDQSAAILVVDDQPIVTTILSAMLAKMGLPDVITAADGFEALEKLGERRCALVIADIGMVPMSGLQLLRAMRGDPRLKGIPVLVMTASRDEAHQAEARRSLANGYLMKPFTPEMLREAIARILSVWGPQDAGESAA